MSHLRRGPSQKRQHSRQLRNQHPRICQIAKAIAPKKWASKTVQKMWLCHQVTLALLAVQRKHRHWQHDGVEIPQGHPS